MTAPAPGGARLDKEHRLTAYRSSTELAFAKWTLPPEKSWPGDVLPEFILSEDSKKTRGYPVLTSEAAGVGRRAFLSPVDAAVSHRAGLTSMSSGSSLSRDHRFRS